LRWSHDGAAAVSGEYLRVRSAGCTTTCGASAVYRMRAYDTTLRLPRFNNSATQVTLLVLQNASDASIVGHVRFWDGVGDLLGEQTLVLGPWQLQVVNTAAVPGAGGQSGTVTVSHDGPYAALRGKGVAVEPATGFTFDTALEPRPR
jgi:hypothetical protein